MSSNQCDGLHRLIRRARARVVRRQIIRRKFVRRREPELAHLSLLGGSTTREAAPGLHRGQKVCPTRAMF
jgi:hypothetical protein